MMISSIGFIHTANVHVVTFEQLVGAIQPTCAVQHIVVPELLEQARQEGLTPAVAQQVAQSIQQLQAQGAERIICTCSTLGGLAETLDLTVIRVDRAMAEQAIATGSRIAVVAALASTLEPTHALLNAIAQHQAKTIEIRDYCCLEAWESFLANDQTSYLQQIASVLETIEQVDVIVLAQASMAAAIQLCQQSIPILSSPRIAIEALFDPKLVP